MVKMFLRMLAAALSAAGMSAPAQTAPPSARPDPLDARAPVPPVVYRSSLPTARTADAAPAIPWREANDTVARIGGWRSYAREAQASEPPAAAASTPAAPASAPAQPMPAGKSMPVPTGHGGHKTP